MIRWFKTLFVMMTPLFALAQSAEGPEMADLMRENGKIYVVVAVLMIIFIGMVVYLIRMDRRIGKMEKELRK